MNVGVDGNRLLPERVDENAIRHLASDAGKGHQSLQGSRHSRFPHPSGRFRDIAGLRAVEPDGLEDPFDFTTRGAGESLGSRESRKEIRRDRVRHRISGASRENRADQDSERIDSAGGPTAEHRERVTTGESPQNGREMAHFRDSIYNAGVKIAILRLPNGSGLPLPAYQSENAAGMDLPAAHDQVLEPGSIAAVPCGFSIAVPSGYEAQIRPRSGLASQGITVANSPGTVDSDYRGEVKVLLANHGREPFRVTRGMRIAQMVIAPVGRAEWVESAELPPSLRGAGGFGHTGI